MREKIIMFVLLFLVSWKAAYWVSEACPDAGKRDVYGNLSSFRCAVNHGHFEYETRSTRFNTRDEVQDFIKNAPSNCSDFVIEEIKE